MKKNIGTELVQQVYQEKGLNKGKNGSEVTENGFNHGFEHPKFSSINFWKNMFTTPLLPSFCPKTVFFKACMWVKNGSS